MPNTDDTTNLINAAVGARLLMIDAAEFEKLRREKWFSPAATKPDRYHPVTLTQGYIKFLKDKYEGGKTAAEAAAHLNLNRRNFIDHVDRGAITRQPSGQYRLDVVREEYIAHLVSVAAGRADADDEESRKMRSRILAAKADMIEIERRKAIGGWAPIDLMIAKVTERNLVTRELILATPGMMADDLAHRPREDIFERLDNHLRGVLNELAEPRDIEDAAAAANTD